VSTPPANSTEPSGRVINARLQSLLDSSPRGRCYSQGEIAAAAGCSRSLIYLVEQRAVKKIRKELARRGLGAEALL
jgi:hypothetical protein